MHRGRAAVVGTGTNPVAVTATDASGNAAVAEYEVDVDAASETFTYDANGNLTADSTRMFEWDAANRLVRVLDGATELAAFAYYDEYGINIKRFAQQAPASCRKNQQNGTEGQKEMEGRRVIAEDAAKAELLERQGRWEEALAIWSQLVLDARNVRHVTRAAMAALECGAVADAEKYLRAIRELDPADADAAFQLGILLQHQDRLVESRAALEEGLWLEERQDILTILGSVLRRIGDYTGAEAALRRSLELSPDDDEAHWGLALVLKETQPELAIAHMRRALEIDPELKQTRTELGVLLQHVGRLEEAEMEFRHALSSDPHDPWAHGYLGTLLLVRGAYDEAETVLQAAIQMLPDEPAFFVSLGDTLWRQQREQDAEGAYLHALSLDTNNYLANLRYGQLLKRQGRLKRARMYIERCVRSKPYRATARAMLAELDVVQTRACSAGGLNNVSSPAASSRPRQRGTP